ncbi:uncharacterized protein [Watersipora subatra]|uniref:uncharacterized protein n=1 Tax=Watersipora subatra TaxID=2589382 RepID=UPI00355B4CE4
MESTDETNGVIAVSIANGVEMKLDTKENENGYPEHDSHSFPDEFGAKHFMDNSRPTTKRVKKGIYISYSPDAGFEERAFVSDMVRQLKENNMADDIWFDKDENCIDSPIWFSQRMEAAERCQAAILILSDQYFTCPVSVYEARTLMERNLSQLKSVQTYSVLYSKLTETEISKHYASLLENPVDLSTAVNARLSMAEKTSVVLGSIMETLEKFAVINTPLKAVDDVEARFDGKYKSKKICRWDTSNLQEWLHDLGIKEFYRQSFAERMIDGFLLISMGDDDMVNHLAIDSRIVRKKIMQNILAALDREQKLADNWHLRARTVRAKANAVYLIYDPADVRLAQTFKVDLNKKNLQVIHHQKLGQSKEEFLHLNGPFMASCNYVLLVLTEHATSSPFVFHEMLFADWLGKKIIVALFKNDWLNLRPSMKAVIGECLAVDFERNLYSDGMDVLEHHLKPLRALPGVVLEQSYLNKMAEGLRPLAQLAATNAESAMLLRRSNRSGSQIFISYQWDMQSKVDDIAKMLETHGFQCWADNGAQMRGHSSLSTRSSTSPALHESNSSLQSTILRNMKSASLVFCCVTPKYIQSDNCLNDLKLAEALDKPVIALLLRFCSWPPEGAPPSVKKILSKCVDVVEMYNDKLYRKNQFRILERVKRLLTL